MNKEEILEKSRQENKNQDVYEKQIMTEGGNIGAIAAAALATIFFIVQIFLGLGMNYALYAVIFTVPAASFIYKAIKLKRRHEIILAVLYSVSVLLFSAAYFFDLLSKYEIL